MTRSIVVKNLFEHTHLWLGAPVEVNFLRNAHRHVFHITSTIEVFHDDRELEFILVQHKINDFLRSQNWSICTSCEMFAEAVAKFILETYGKDRQVEVQVTEDGENGAIYKTH